MPVPRVIPLVLVLAFLVTVDRGFAADWPQFLGPQGDGHAAEKNLPNEWSAEKNIAWRKELPGQGWSSPVVVGRHLYLTTAVPGAADGDGLSLRILCLDARTGNLLWDREHNHPTAKDIPKIHSKNSHASPTPIVAGDKVYVHFGHHGTSCWTTGGEKVWSQLDLKYAPVHGNGGSPALVDSTLIFSCDGASDPIVVGLDAATGQETWRYKRPGDPFKKFAFCTPTPIEVNGKRLVVIPGAESVAALDPRTGDEQWLVRYTGYSVIPRPLFGHGLLFFSTGYDSPVVMALRPDGTGDVTDTHVAWENKRGAPHTPSLLLVGDELYTISDGGVITCVTAKTGEQLWQERVGGKFSASPIYADGKIYVLSEDGKTLVFRPGRKFEKVGESDFQERALATFAAADGALFARTDKAVYRLQEMK